MNDQHQHGEEEDWRSILSARTRVTHKHVDPGHELGFEWIVVSPNEICIRISCAFEEPKRHRLDIGNVNSSLLKRPFGS